LCALGARAGEVSYAQRLAQEFPPGSITTKEIAERALSGSDEIHRRLQLDFEEQRQHCANVFLVNHCLDSARQVQRNGEREVRRITLEAHDLQRQLDARARELLEQVVLASDAEQRTVELPYGRKRALEIATTMAAEPELMLLDEPTQGMGHEDVGRITELIRRVAVGRTVLMVEHNMGVVAGLCDRITVLARGSVLAEGSYAEVSADAAVREAYMGGSETELQGITH